ncbi:hypothetical protein FHS85_005168 [Rhodoligotrophos appendicifer]|uniref:hypothetical protein n=1 Tax=Rhodoligotrophos appendicifer TaxID=987056 RepID=UPI001478FD25|nr:hypothetical protein [Rhodoligotrophos appendicifer]
MNFEAIGAAALAAYPGLLRQWFPGGRVYGHEFKVGSLQGEKGESLSINITTGAWADFAANHQGGDPISLYAAMTGVKQGEAAVALAEILGGSLLPEPRQAEAREKAPKRQTWTPVHPVPDGAGEPLKSHRDFGRHTTSWAYRDAEGRLLGYICRFDMPDGGKEVLPQSYCTGPDGKRAWRWMSFAKPRPLYGLERLAEQPRANVVIVEGEKCADRARQLFPQHVVVTWPSGGKAVRHADWTPLKGRKSSFGRTPTNPVTSLRLPSPKY